MYSTAKLFDFTNPLKKPKNLKNLIPDEIMKHLRSKNIEKIILGSQCKSAQKLFKKVKLSENDSS